MLALGNEGIREMDNVTNVTSAYVGDLMIPEVDTIAPGELVVVAKRRMESQGSRSLIVVEDDRPVGVVQWRGLARQDGNVPIADVMMTEIPVLRADMTVDEVREQISRMDVDLDHLPVVDAAGALIGEVPRGAITKGETATGEATQKVVSGPEADRDRLQAIHLEQGMKVVGAAGNKLGTVDQVDLNADGNIAHFTVKHGLITKHVKRLPADVIAHVQGDEVRLNIDQTEFKMLADLGDEV